MSNTNYAGEKFPKFNKIGKRLKDVVKNIEDNFTDDDKILLVEKFKKTDKNKKDVIYEFLKEIAGEPNEKKEYRGIYIFAEKKEDGTFEYMYTGISRKAIQRLNDHVNRSDKGTATWAYMMVKKSADEKLKKEIDFFHHRKVSKKEENRKNALKELIQEKIINIQKDYISNLYITFVPINENYFMHMVEPYVAAKLKCYWNSFKTH